MRENRLHPPECGRRAHSLRLVAAMHVRCVDRITSVFARPSAIRVSPSLAAFFARFALCAFTPFGELESRANAIQSGCAVFNEFPRMPNRIALAVQSNPNVRTFNCFRSHKSKCSLPSLLRVFCLRSETERDNGRLGRHANSDARDRVPGNHKSGDPEEKLSKYSARAFVNYEHRLHRVESKAENK